jgi:hypothetical protein
MDAEAQRLLQDFATNLNRTVPQPELAEWPRLYEFIIHVSRRQAPSAEEVGHALVQAGLDWEEIEPYLIFYGHAVELLRRAQEQAITGGRPASRTTTKRTPRDQPPDG